MELDQWLRANGMETQKFAKMVGCTRKTIHKVKKFMPIKPDFAKTIFLITGGQVCPVQKEVGRPRKVMNKEHNQ